MHIDAFVAANQPTWQRLEALVRRGEHGIGRLTAEELDELVRAYQRTATHLSIARTTYGDAGLVASLSALLGRAGALVYGTRPASRRAAGRFFTETFPAALWALRWFVLAAFLLFTVPAVGMGVWVATTPAALDAAAPAAVREQYVQHDFADYYTANPSAVFATQVATNNIQVGFLAFAGGILLCVPTAFILALNGANVGVVAGLFAVAGEQARFWGLILPHGLLELTAVFIAGGTGLRLGWTLVDPGDRPRGVALVEQGRRAMAVVIGLVAVFGVAGLVEGFVTGAPWPAPVRVGIGAAVEVAFLAYAWVLGRSATGRGLTGALGELEPARRPEPYSRPEALTSR